MVSIQVPSLLHLLQWLLLHTHFWWRHLGACWISLHLVKIMFVLHATNDEWWWRRSSAGWAILIDSQNIMYFTGIAWLISCRNSLILVHRECRCLLVAHVAVVIVKGRAPFCICQPRHFAIPAHIWLSNEPTHTEVYCWIWSLRTQISLKLLQIYPTAPFTLTERR